MTIIERGKIAEKIQLERNSLTSKLVIICMQKAKDDEIDILPDQPLFFVASRPNTDTVFVIKHTINHDYQTCIEVHGRSWGTKRDIYLKHIGKTGTRYEVGVISAPDNQFKSIIYSRMKEAGNLPPSVVLLEKDQNFIAIDNTLFGNEIRVNTLLTQALNAIVINPDSFEHIQPKKSRDTMLY